MKRLVMTFYSEVENRRRRITLNEPKDDLTPDQIMNAMQALVDAKVLDPSYVIERATIVETNTNEFFDLV